MPEMTITKAVQKYSPDDKSLRQWLRWYADGCDIRAQRGDWPEKGDPVIGRMDSPLLADEAARAHNNSLESVQTDLLPVAQDEGEKR